MQDLEEYFLLDLTQFKIIKLEIGVNIITDKDVNLLLNSNLHSYAKGKYTTSVKMDNKGWMTIFEKTDYILKLYNKNVSVTESMYKIPDKEVIRIEFAAKNSKHVNRMASRQDKEIVTLSYLKDGIVLRSLKQYFLDNTNNILFIDKQDYLDELDPNDKRLFHNCMVLIPHHNQECSSEAKRKQFQKFKLILEDNGLQSTQKKILLDIDEKLDSLERNRINENDPLSCMFTSCIYIPEDDYKKNLQEVNDISILKDVQTEYMICDLIM